MPRVRKSARRKLQEVYEMARYKPKPREKGRERGVHERRKSRRVAASEIPSLKGARLLAGPEIQLVNLSSGGAMFESTTRILPGAKICVRLVAEDALFLLHGRVLQSRVSALCESGLTYQCRIVFDEEFTLLSGCLDEPLAGAEVSEPESIERAAMTGQSFPAVINEESASSMTVTVPVPQSERDLRHIFGR